MKIIQTLWLPHTEINPLANKCGWAAPEYHWMSWAMSVNMLKKFYDEVELYTTVSGKQVLIDQLALPYTKVHIVDAYNEIPQSAWALSKVMTYQLQNEPFLHVDGDVFIFNRFPEDLLEAQLISQSKEIDFFHYNDTLEKVKHEFTFVPALFQQQHADPLVTYNAGIFGGSDVSFIRRYAAESIKFVFENHHHFTNLENSTAYCMLFEQWLFSIMSENEGKHVTTFFEEPVHDAGYPGLGNFWKKKKDYLHLMGMSKRKRFFLKQMMCKLRQEFPGTYYNILAICKQEKIIPESRVYSLPELDPLTWDANYYVKLMNDYQPSEILTGTQKWTQYYAKDSYIFNQVEQFFGLPDDMMRNQILTISDDLDIEEITEPELKQTLKLPDTFKLNTAAIPLENLEIVILELLKECDSTMDSIVESLLPYFDSQDVLQNKPILVSYVKEKIRSLMSYGALRWADFKPNYSKPILAD